MTRNCGKRHRIVLQMINRHRIVYEPRTGGPAPTPGAGPFPRHGSVTAVGCVEFLTFRRTDHDHAHEDERAHPEVHAVADPAGAGPGCPGPARICSSRFGGTPRGGGAWASSPHWHYLMKSWRGFKSRKVSPFLSRGVMMSELHSRNTVYSVNSRRSRASGLGPRTSRGLGLVPGRDDRSHVRGNRGAVTWHPNPDKRGWTSI